MLLWKIDAFWDFWHSRQDLYIELYPTYRGDEVMIETSDIYTAPYEYHDDEGYGAPICNEIYAFRVYRYDEAAQSYEIDITETLSEYDNLAFQQLIYDHHVDLAAAAAEAQYEAGYDR